MGKDFELSLLRFLKLAFYVLMAPILQNDELADRLAGQNKLHGFQITPTGQSHTMLPSSLPD